MTYMTTRDERVRGTEPRIGETEAKQAVEPHRLRYMLGFGIVGVVLAFAIVYVVFFAG